MERDCVLKGDSQQAACVLVNGHTDLSHEIVGTGSSPICLPAQMTCPGRWWVEFGVNTCAAVKYSMGTAVTPSPNPDPSFTIATNVSMCDIFKYST